VSSPILNSDGDRTVRIVDDEGSLGELYSQYLADHYETRIATTSGDQARRQPTGIKRQHHLFSVAYSKAVVFMSTQHDCLEVTRDRTQVLTQLVVIDPCLFGILSIS
jgi:hypothetical protein